MADKIIIGVLRALLTADTAQFEQNLARAGTSLKNFSRESGAAGRNLTQLGVSLTRTLTIPLGLAGAAIAKAGIDFESSFAGVRKTVAASEPEFAKISASFRQLAKEIPINVNELNKLGEAAGALGIPKEQLVDFARVMAEIGVTTNVTAEQAAESIAKIQNIFGAAGQNTRAFANTLVDLGNKGASTESQILELANRMASAAHTAGITQKELLGFAAAIANVGIDAEAGGTSFSRTIQDISVAIAKGGAELDKFGAIIGKTGAEFGQMFQADATDTLVQFIDGLRRVQNQGGNLIATLIDLGVVEQRQQRLLRDLTLSGRNLSDALRIAGSDTSRLGALSDEANKRFATTASQLKILAGQFRDVGITVGTSLLPLIKETVKFMERLIPLLDSAGKAFAALPAPLQGAVIGFGGLLALSGPMIYFLAQMIQSVSIISGAFAKGGFAAKLLGTNFNILGKSMSGATLLLRGFAGGLLAIAIPFALNEIIKLFTQIQGLLSDQKKWKADVVSEQAVHFELLARASALARQNITDFHEAWRIVQEDIKRQQDVKARGFDAMSTGAVKLTTDVRRLAVTMDGSRVVVTKLDGELDAFGNVIRNYVAELADAQRELNKLDATQRRNIQAAIDSGASQEEQIALLKSYGIQVSKAEAVLKIFGREQKATADEASDMARWIKNNEEQLKRLEKSLNDATLAGVSMEEFLKQYGQETKDAVERAKIFKQVVPDSVMRAAAAWALLLLQAERFEALKPFEGSEIAAPPPLLFPAKEDEIFAERERRTEEFTARSSELEAEAAQFALDMAKKRGASELELFELTEELERAKVNATIRSENLRFAAAVKFASGNKELLDELKASHEMTMLALEDQWRIGAQRRAALFETEFEKLLKSIGNMVKESAVGNLGTLFFGQLGHDTTGELKKAAQEAELEYLKLQRTGRATAKELKVAFDKWREAEEKANFTFGERWAQFWGGLKQTFIQVLDDMLQYFVSNFIKGLLRGLSAAKLGQAFANALTGGTAGALLGGGAAAASSFAAAEVAGVESAIFGAGTGTGAGSFLTNPAFWTNPVTLGVAAAAAVLGWGIGKKGWFRGGEEALKVNPRRDQFLAQFGTAGTGPNSGFFRLAEMLTRFTGQEGGGTLFTALRTADSVKEFERAQSGIVSLLSAQGKRIRSFALGGFVAPGDIVPAVLHGGSHGEAIMPLGSTDEDAQTGSRALRPNIVHQHITIQGVLDRDSVRQVWREHILPLERQATILNTDQISAERTRRGGRR